MGLGLAFFVRDGKPHLFGRISRFVQAFLKSSLRVLTTHPSTLDARKGPTCYELHHLDEASQTFFANSSVPKHPKR